MSNLLKQQSNTTNKAGRTDLLERVIVYSRGLISFCEKLEQFGAARILTNQLLHSGTAIVANIHEAQGGRSRADFISKISIAYKEALETLYWLRILNTSSFTASGEIAKWLDETSQLAKILSSILLTSKQKKDL